LEEPYPMSQARIRSSFLKLLLGVAIGALGLGILAQAFAQQPLLVPKLTWHGRPFYPIGVYNYAVADGVSSQSISSLKEMAAAGFNTLLQYDHDAPWETRQPALTPAFLSTARTYHISIVDELWTYNLTTDNWIGMPSMDVPGSPLADQVNRLKGNFDLLGYETFDEAAGYRLLSSTAEEKLQQGYEFVKSLDPIHPIFSNENPISSLDTARADRRWAAIGDALSCDWYPVDPTWTHPPWPLHGVPDNMDYLYEVVSASADTPLMPTKPIYMVLQGFPINGVVPTFADCRNSMYRSIIHGAAASIWWGTYHLKPTDPLWLTIQRCAGELRDLEPALEQGERLGVVRHDAATGASYSSPRIHLSDSRLEAIAFRNRDPRGLVYNTLVVANTSPMATVTSTISVQGWKFARNKNKVRVLFETDTHGNNRAMIPATVNTWTDTFAPNEVHVYTDRKLTHVPGDFDGDGVADTAVYDPVHGEVRITESASGETIYRKCGPSPKVIAADVDGDGKGDLAVYDPKLRAYRVWLSTTNYTTSRVLSTVRGTRLPVLR
jgi:hypothetical protein